MPRLKLLSEKIYGLSILKKTMVTFRYIILLISYFTRYANKSYKSSACLCTLNSTNRFNVHKLNSNTAIYV